MLLEATPAVTVTAVEVITNLLAVPALTVMLVVSFTVGLPELLSVNVSFKPACASVGAARPLNVATPLETVAAVVPVKGPVPACTVAVTVEVLSPVTTLP